MLNESDLAELRAHGVVVFGGKVIFDSELAARVVDFSTEAVGQTT